MNTLENLLILFVSSIATGVGGWIFGRRKNNADARLVEAQAKLEETRAQTQQIENLGKAVDIWKEAAENLNAQVRIYNENSDSLKGENSGLKTQLNELNQKFEEQSKKLNDMMSENGRLKREIEKLKKKPD